MAGQPAAKCTYYLPNKRRTCRFDAKPGHAYCGNHWNLATGLGIARVPCPLDPGQCVAAELLQLCTLLGEYELLAACDHTVLPDELQAHLKKCTARLQQASQTDQTWYRQDVNAGDVSQRDVLTQHIHPAALAAARAAAASEAADGVGGSRNRKTRARHAQRARESAVATALAAAASATVAGTPGGAQDGNGTQMHSEGGAAGAAAGVAAADGAPDSAKRGLGGAAGTGDGTGGAPELSSAALRALYAAAMGRERFLELVARVRAAHDQLAADHLPFRDSVLAPPSCRAALASDNWRPFSLKHAQQQASIVGNMQAFGLLEDAAQRVFVEFGAGRGYLSSTLADAGLGANKLLLVDCRGFRFKAERSLRQMEGIVCDRVRADIKDFCPAGHDALAGRHWVGLGKHLCGAATDFTLRAVVQGAPGASGGAGAAGAAVATCCHHRCMWGAYCGKRLFEGLGFTPQEFEVVCWMSGWALCGHETPEGGGSGGDGAASRAARCDGGAGGAVSAVAGGGSDDEGDARSDVSDCMSDMDEPGCCGGGGWDEQGGAGDGAAPGAAADTSDGTACKAGQRSTAAAAGSSNGSGSGGGGGGGGSGGAGFMPGAALPRAERIAVGGMAKRLLDIGRLEWLRAQGFKAEMVLYVPPHVSGENRLLLAAPARK